MPLLQLGELTQEWFRQLEAPGEQGVSEKTPVQQNLELWIFRKIVQDALHDFKGGRSGNCGNTSVAMVPNVGSIAKAFSDGERVLAAAAGSSAIYNPAWQRWTQELSRKKPSGHVLERIYLGAAMEAIQGSHPILDSVLTVMEFDVKSGPKPDDEDSAVAWSTKQGQPRYAIASNLTGKTAIPGILSAIQDKLSPVFTDAWGKGGDAVLNALFNVTESGRRCKNNLSNILDPASSSSDYALYYENELTVTKNQTAFAVLGTGFQVFFSAMLTAFCAPVKINLIVTGCRLAAQNYDGELGIEFTCLLNDSEHVITMYHNDNSIPNICEAVDSIDGRKSKSERPGIVGLERLYKSALGIEDDKFLTKNPQLKALIVSYKGFGDWIQWYYVSGLKLEEVIPEDHSVITRTNDKFVGADFAQGGIQPCLLSAVALQTFLADTQRTDTVDVEDDEEGSKARVSMIGEALHLPDYYPKSWKPHILNWIQEGNPFWEEKIAELENQPVEGLKDLKVEVALPPESRLEYEGNVVDSTKLKDLTFAGLARTLSCLKLAIDQTVDVLKSADEAVALLEAKIEWYSSVVFGLVADLTSDVSDDLRQVRDIKLIAIECGNVGGSIEEAAESFTTTYRAFIKLVEQAEDYLESESPVMNNIRESKKGFADRIGKISQLRSKLSLAFEAASSRYESVNTELRNDIVGLLNGENASGPLARLNPRRQRRGEPVPVLTSLYGVWKTISSMSLLYGCEGDGEGGGDGATEMIVGGTKRERSSNSAANTPPQKRRLERTGTLLRPVRRNPSELRAVPMDLSSTAECRNSWNGRNSLNCSAQDSQPAASSFGHPHRLTFGDAVLSQDSQHVASFFGEPDRLAFRDAVSPQVGMRWSASQYAATVSDMGRKCGALGAVLTSSRLTPFFVLSNMQGIWDQILSLPGLPGDSSSAASASFGGKPSRSIKKQRRRTGKSHRRHRRTPKSKTLRFK